MRRAVVGNAITAFAPALLAAPALGQTSPGSQIAAPLPPIDLGQTNILSGEGAPGKQLEILFVGAVANHLADKNGAQVTGRNHQRVGAVIIHPIYMSRAILLGGHPGIEVLQPINYIDNDFAAGGGRHFGLGDFTFTPFLQWSPEKTGAGTVSARFGFQVTAPTGDRSLRRLVNTSQGAWQISPYLTATWRADRRLEFSALGIYGRSWSSDGIPGVDPRPSVQAGQVAVLNVSGSWLVAPRVRAGLGGYLLNQLTSPTIDGVRIPGRREEVYGIGPVSRFEVGRFVLLAAAFGEFAARNRPEGFTVNVRIQMPIG